MEFYAHDNELLIHHLTTTADLAEEFGSDFSNDKIARQLGLLHDIGKHTAAFQDVLHGKAHKKDHAIVAAKTYIEHGIVDNTFMRRQLALIMASHHSYLYSSYDSIKSDLTIKETDIIKYPDMNTKDKDKNVALRNESEYQDILSYIKDNNLIIPLANSDYFDISSMTENEKMFYIRMLYSCLVDADYTATAMLENMDYKQSSENNHMNIDTLLSKLDDYKHSLPNDSIMNEIRDMVYDACCRKGMLYSKFSTLTAPTGTGKTLALMAFALNNMKTFNRKRIFIILPFLSIIEQNANVYRQIFGDVVFVDDSQTEHDDVDRICADRWSSQIIITTSVNFFETLFACKATDARKLHSVANSVIVFDECQTLPTNVLNSTIEILTSLCNHYNTSVLFSTATKPSYEYRNHTEQKDTVQDPILAKQLGIYSKPKILSDMQFKADEIINDVDSLFAKYSVLKNTNVVFDNNKSYTYADLIDYYYNETQVLYVFNTVKHATDMYEAMTSVKNPDDCFLITSNFCAIDKTAIIDEINNRLKNKQPVYLCATQCIEAGVDFDFPAGAREFAPYDSIIQTAGRINRNGRFDGKFLIFLSESHSRYDYPSADYQWASQVSYELSKKTNISLYDLFIMDTYFKQLYSSVNYGTDKDSIAKAIGSGDYKCLSDAYSIIEDANQITIIVKPLYNYDSDLYNACISDIETHDYTITKSLMKKLAPFTIHMFLSRNFNFRLLGPQLSIRKFDAPVNWYILNAENAYTKNGFDKKYEKAFIF